MSNTEPEYIVLFLAGRRTLLQLTLVAAHGDDEAIGALKWLRRHGHAGAQEAIDAAYETRARTAEMIREAVVAW